MGKVTSCLFLLNNRSSNFDQRFRSSNKVPKRSHNIKTS
jgi:hypothetical protein